MLLFYCNLTGYALYGAGGLASSTLLTRPFISFFVGEVGTSGIYAAIIIPKLLSTHTESVVQMSVGNCQALNRNEHLCTYKICT